MPVRISKIVNLLEGMILKSDIIGLLMRIERVTIKLRVIDCITYAIIWAI